MLDRLSRRLDAHPRLFAFVSLAVASAALVHAGFGSSDMSMRVALGLTGGAICLINLGPLLVEVLRIPARLARRLGARAPIRGGYSYGEVKARAMDQLGWTIARLAGLIFLLVIAQGLIGFLTLAGGARILAAIDATLWTGVAVGLHLGWRTWKQLRFASDRRFELGG